MGAKHEGTLEQHQWCIKCLGLWDQDFYTRMVLRRKNVVVVNFSEESAPPLYQNLSIPEDAAILKMQKRFGSKSCSPKSSGNF